MKMTTILRILALAVALLTAPLAARANDAAGGGSEARAAMTTITLKGSVKVAGYDVRLSDIAELSGGTVEQQDSLREVVLGLSPAIGETYQVGSRFVAERIREAGMALDSIRFAGAGGTRIRPATQTLTGVSLQQEAAAELRRLFADAPLSGRIQIDPGRTPRDLVVPIGREGLKVEYRPRRATPNAGNAWVDAYVSVDGRAYPTVAIPFQLRIFAKVLMVSEPIERNDALDDTNLSLVETELPQSSGARPLTDFRDVDGRVARRPLRRGEILTARAVYRPFVVMRGAQVKLELVDGPLRVTTHGTAEVNGYLGQDIAVKNTRSGRIVTGRVVDAKTVRIQAP